MGLNEVCDRWGLSPHPQTPASPADIGKEIPGSYTSAEFDGQRGMVIPVFSLAHNYYTVLRLQLPDRFLARLKGLFYDLHFRVPCVGVHVEDAALGSLGALSSAYGFREHL